MDSEAILRCEHVFKSFDDGTGNGIMILEDANMEIFPGDLISVRGKSGSGKSTFLYILSSLLRPDEGKVFFNGRDIYSMKDREMLVLRQNSIGFVFQDNLLLEDLSVEENVILPLRIAGKFSSNSRSRVLDYAERMGISGILKKRARLISSGEKARVSLLRAIAVGKDIVFLDEPTGALDNENARNIEALIVGLAKSADAAFVYVTHDEAFAGRADRQFSISGRHVAELTVG